ncbi:unnamed protein product [Heligmosomoides polygyrus]|uniref:Uncharacterized protein n=1 Tax=Heligmosomoides polygyrus TaxID=6339 RepID=A0A183FJR0_HELPZ|nr:unnamed protein product [Heligmosomoides polygyrus]
MQPSASEPGYLPDYQGDRYTNEQRIAETQALNRPFFDTIGGAPLAPPLTPAQSTQQQNYPNQHPTSYSVNGSSSYNPSTGYGSQQYNPSSSYSTNGLTSSYYTPNAGSSSPTRYYDPVLNTNLGYPNQNQQYQYGTGTTQPSYYQNSNYGSSAGYGLQNQQMYNQQQLQSGQQNNQLYGNAQSWCCGASSSSCCYQTSTGASNSAYYYDPSMSSTSATSGYSNGQYAYGNSGK